MTPARLRYFNDTEAWFLLLVATRPLAFGFVCNLLFYSVLFLSEEAEAPELGFLFIFNLFTLATTYKLKH